jgi:SAM-dependent methyltransferase
MSADVSTTELAAAVDRLRVELARTRSELAALRAEVGASRAGPAGPGRFAMIYPAFEDRFRGTEAEVRERLAVYLPRVRAAARLDRPGPRVLDVGPGRGEWLALLADAGLPAVGAEYNAAMAVRLRGHGFEVVTGDGTGYLEAVQPGSLDVVTAFHVVEHLDVDALLALLAAAHRALRPGGLLVAETPNPTNLVMGACNFYLDPTHRAPIPPAQLEFLVRTAASPHRRSGRCIPRKLSTSPGSRCPGWTRPRARRWPTHLREGCSGHRTMRCSRSARERSHGERRNTQNSLPSGSARTTN